MALNRRQFLVGLPVGCALLEGCAQGPLSPTTHYYAEIARSSNPSAKETVLVCMPETPQTMEVIRQYKPMFCKSCGRLLYLPE